MNLDTETNDHNTEGAYESFLNDTYIGYPTLMDAVNDCRASAQAEVVARILNRENVFISGPAGSGKSFIIGLVKNILDDKFKHHFIVSMTASTGLAASNIGGKTIHSWSGLGIYSGKLKQRGAIDKEALGIYRKQTDLEYADVLVIDEISMLHAYYLDNLNVALKRIRKNDEPFGGIQVILMGDFMQLPPVTPRSSEKKDGINYGFAITSDAWKEGNFSICYLDKVHRASDPALKRMLQRISVGKPDEETMALIGQAEERDRDPEKVYSVLFTTNKNVDAYNQEKLNENPNPSIYMQPSTMGSRKHITELMKQHAIPESLEMKKDAVVIVTANIPEERVYNGTVARFFSYDRVNDTVTLITNDGRFVQIPKISREKEEKVKKSTATNSKDEKEMDEVSVNVVAVIRYFPIKLGYAITVHKSQGQTFDAVEVDLSKCFAPGLGYVALSRVRNASDLIINGFSPRALEVDPDSLKYSKYVKKQALLSRKNFIDNIEFYDDILKNPEKLSSLWHVEESGMSRLAKSRKEGA